MVWIVVHLVRAAPCFIQYKKLIALRISKYWSLSCEVFSLKLTQLALTLIKSLVQLKWVKLSRVG